MDEYTWEVCRKVDSGESTRPGGGWQDPWECKERKLVKTTGFDPRAAIELAFPEYKWGFIIKTSHGWVASNREGKEAVEAVPFVE